MSFAIVGASSSVIAQAANPSAEDAFDTMISTARFLTQSTFGPNPNEVIVLAGSSPSDWLLSEFNKPASLNSELIAAYIALGSSTSGGGVIEEDEIEDGEDEGFEDEEVEFDEDDVAFEDFGAEDEDSEEGDEEGDEGDVEDEENGEENEGEENEGEGDDEEEVEEEELSLLGAVSPGLAFWKNAISGPDQVRQRMAYALSQILVVSNSGGEFLTDTPLAMGYYQDILTQNALGNYRDLLDAVTYSPAMGYYLTYLGNRKGDPVTGRVPDENYARELMQLFTIGLVELNMDGSAKTDAAGDSIETYSNADITGLARVFTGLAAGCFDFDEDAACEGVEDLEGEDTQGEDSNYEVIYAQPMSVFPNYHSDLEKSFLGTTIPANTGAEDSIRLALDTIFAHPNVAPFVSRQLIQRFVTSDPAPAYIERVATAFEAGTYLLPNGASVGDARRGDLKATLAAILFDDAARSTALSGEDTFGKIREPVVRFTNWARAFNVSAVTPEFMPQLWETNSPAALGQQAYGSSSVFNFYRPGYVAPGTLSGAAGLTVPELQIVNAATVPGYANFMTWFIDGSAQSDAALIVQELNEEEGLQLDVQGAQTSFIPDYSFEQGVAQDGEALVDRIGAILTYGSLTPETKAGIIAAVDGIPLGSVNEDSGADGATQRIHLAILMVMTSPEYLVQR
ncbi:MAG: DUF1800 family protein [Alphaproteobacteria bacterium]|nr:DUF1800 family protein [Alphaproteobacteria bacterium]